MLDVTLIREASRVVMRPDDHELKTTLLHTRKETSIDVENRAVLTTRPRAAICVLKWVKVS